MSDCFYKKSVKTNIYATPVIDKMDFVIFIVIQKLKIVDTWNFNQIFKLEFPIHDVLLKIFIDYLNYL